MIDRQLLRKDPEALKKAIARKGIDAPIDEVARACILVALAGVGLSTGIAQLRTIGPRPVFLGFGIFQATSAFSTSPTGKPSAFTQDSAFY